MRNFDLGGFNLIETSRIDFESKNNLRANIGFRFNIAACNITGQIILFQNIQQQL